MKKVILALILLATAFEAGAALSNGGSVTNAPAYRDTSGRGVQPVVILDGSGSLAPTPIPGGDRVVLNGISGAAATSYFDKLTSSVASGSNTIGNVGVTSTPRALTYTEFSIFTTTALTVAATPIYLTTSALSAVYLDNTFGAVTVSYRITNSSTVPADMTTVKFGLIPGEKILIPSQNGHLPMDGNYLWYVNPGQVTITGKNMR